MKTASQFQKERLQSVGTTMSATPMLRELHNAVKEMFDSGASEAEVRQYLAENNVDDE